jgi:hypothetical protein
LLASTGFRVTSGSIKTVALLSHNFLFALDAVLGSTETSRAIAAIITLVKTEFQNSVTGNKGERVGVKDLIVGACGFAILQRCGRRQTEREYRDKGGEESIWDIVILDNGVRADVVGTVRLEEAESLHDINEGRPESFVSTRGDQEPIRTIRRNAESVPTVPQISLPFEARRDWSDGEVRQYVMDKLPPGTHFSVKTEKVTATTITVDVFDPDHSDITAPPGTLMIEERFHDHQDTDSGKSSEQDMERIPRHTIVFQTTWNRTHNADLRHEEERAANNRDETNEDQDRAQDDKVGSPPNESYLSDVETPLILNTTSVDSLTHSRAKVQEVGQSDPNIKPSFIPVAVDSTSPPQTPTHKKRPRKPVSSSSSLSGSETPKASYGKSSLSKIAARVKPTPGERQERNFPLKKAIKKTLSPSQSTTSFKDMVSFGGMTSERKPSSRNASTFSHPSKNPPKKNDSIVKKAEPRRLDKKLPRLPPDRSIASASRASGSNMEDFRSPSRTSYYSIHEKQRESIVAQTDTYFLHSVETRPGSPSLNRTHLRASTGIARAKSEKDIALHMDSSERPNSRTSNHKPSKSFVPSVYSFATTSQTSLVLAPRPRRSVFEDRETIMSLARDGKVPGAYPHKHLVYNIRRFARFSSASYGSQFLHYMGISTKSTSTKISTQDLLHHQEHHSFSKHTGLPPNAILLSPFVDPSGGFNAAGETSSGVPLVYYLSLDQESKAIVLTFRGTLGFEDVLTDMTCDYDELQWQGRSYKVHKGMHASARRLLSSDELMVTIKAALENSPEWGLVLCGHSLGGGVAALLAILLSESSPIEEHGTSFVTKLTPPLLTNGTPGFLQASLPSGRPIHVYAYGPPATLSEPLRVATRGLITTIVNGEDVVPCLSLGVLGDFQSVALEFKTDNTGAKYKLGERIYAGLLNAIRNKFYINQPPLDVMSDPSGAMGEDNWAWAALQVLRATMKADKLLPPGEVFVVETMAVLRRDAFMSDFGDSGGMYPRLGRPATRVQMKWVSDVESRFGEIRFGSGMLGDHSPGRYEASLAALARGVLED